LLEKRLFGAEEVSLCAFVGLFLALLISELMEELKFVLNMELFVYFGELPEYVTAPLPPLLVLMPLFPYKDYSILS